MSARVESLLAEYDGEIAPLEDEVRALFERAEETEDVFAYQEAESMSDHLHMRKADLLDALVEALRKDKED